MCYMGTTDLSMSIFDKCSSLFLKTIIFLTKVLFESKISRYEGQVEMEKRFQTLDHAIMSHVFYHCAGQTKLILPCLPLTNIVAYLKDSIFFITKVLLES
jgi:hypothetical protein